MGLSRNPSKKSKLFSIIVIPQNFKQVTSFECSISSTDSIGHILCTISLAQPTLINHKLCEVNY